MSNPIQEELEYHQRIADEADAEERRLEQDDPIGDDWTEYVRDLYREDE